MWRTDVSVVFLEPGAEIFAWASTFENAPRPNSARKRLAKNTSIPVIRRRLKNPPSPSLQLAGAN
jgi:hypothetical protein